MRQWTLVYHIKPHWVLYLPHEKSFFWGDEKPKMLRRDNKKRSLRLFSENTYKQNIHTKYCMNLNYIELLMILFLFPASIDVQMASGYLRVRSLANGAVCVCSEIREVLLCLWIGLYQSLTICSCYLSALRLTSAGNWNWGVFPIRRGLRDMFWLVSALQFLMDVMAEWLMSRVMGEEEEEEVGRKMKSESKWTLSAIGSQYIKAARPDRGSHITSFATVGAKRQDRLFTSQSASRETKRRPRQLSYQTWLSGVMPSSSSASSFSPAAQVSFWFSGMLLVSSSELNSNALNIESLQNQWADLENRM